MIFCIFATVTIKTFDYENFNDYLVFCLQQIKVR